jgi:hypothetical protein
MDVYLAVIHLLSFTMSCRGCLRYVVHHHLLAPVLTGVLSGVGTLLLNKCVNIVARLRGSKMLLGDEHQRSYFPLRPLKPEKMMLVEDYMDIAMRQRETFLECHRIDLAQTALLPQHGGDWNAHWATQKFFMTKALAITNLIFLHDGTVIFRFKDTVWAASKTCSKHVSCSPCYLCAIKCDVYECAQ